MGCVVQMGFGPDFWYSIVPVKAVRVDLLPSALGDSRSQAIKKRTTYDRQSGER